MFDWQAQIYSRIEAYSCKSRRMITSQIGFGYDGLVVETQARTAIKGFKHEPLYRNEKDVYRRIDEYGLYEVQGCKIPHLLAADDELWCIEMEIVSPPYVLDFAGAYLNFPPDYPPTSWPRGARKSVSNTAMTGRGCSRSSETWPASAFICPM